MVSGKEKTRSKNHGVQMNPKYPVYVISKGRWESRLTSKMLDEMRVPYHIVIEPQEYDDYAAVINPKKIFVLPFSNLGQGSIPARNWVWEHSISIGAKRHWILDDNIRHFRRLYHGIRIQIENGKVFRIMEDFINRYENIALAGPNYTVFGQCGPARKIKKPFIMNTRIYSCILIKNDLPYRWRGRYNEDTDLSLRVLKDGWCTVLFYAFLCDKMATMSMKGGNTEELYKLEGKKDGRFLMAQSLQKQHPDVVRIARKWGRWQHQVNYMPFKNNQLIKKKGKTISNKINEYGMELIHNREKTKVKK
jgi:hypothetical protein